jgi:hypothetical protein
MNRIPRALTVLAIAVIVAGSLPLAVSAQTSPVPDLGNAPFTRLWLRTDYPVLTGQVQRTFYFGPKALLNGQELYKDGPGGARFVTYLDKGRLELTDPTSETVTAGLLAKELISGKMQIGNSEFRSYEPAAVPVAGDPVASNAPTYASFVPVASIEPGTHRADQRIGQTVTDVLNQSGQVGQDAGLMRYGVTLVEYRAELGHNIPNVFADFFARRGSVAMLEDDGTISYAEDQLIDWIKVMGLPLAEPYWAVTPVGGVPKWVLMQPYERRMVTYTPDNDPAFQVEMGNIGQHYLAWRHPDGTLAERPVTVPTPTPTPAPGQAVPAPVNKGLAVKVEPLSGTATTPFWATVEGFQGGEDIAFWFTDPKQTVWYPPEAFTTDKDAVTVIILIIPADAFRRVEKGIWAITCQGSKSGRSGIAYFEIK